MPIMTGADLARARDGIGAFGRWWASELRALVPDRVQLGSRTRARSAEIRPGRDTVAIVRTAGGKAERFVEAKPLSAFDLDNWAELAELLDGYQARISLAAPLIHVVTLRLPKAARSHLRSAIPLQLRDHAPLLPELLAWTIIDQHVQDDRLIVRVVIVRTTTLDDIAAGFLDRDLVAPAILADVGGGKLALLRRAQRPVGSPGSARPWWVAAALLASTPLGMLVALHIAVLDQQSKLAAAEQAAQPRLAAETRLRDRAALARSLRMVLARPSVTATLDGLAAALPASAHAIEISLPDIGPLAMTLRTNDPDAVAKALAQAPGVISITRTGQSTAVDGTTQLGFTAVLK